MAGKLNKRVVLLILLVVAMVIGYLAVASRGDEAQSGRKLEKVRVQAGWLLNGEFAQVCTAINRGFYKDEGLDVELIPGGPSGANFIVATNALAQDDSIDIAIDGDIIPLLRGKGVEDESKQLKLKAFAAFWKENPYGFFVRKDSGINSIEDFTKKKSDGSTVKLGLTADAVVQDAIAKDQEISVDDLNIVRVGFDATPLLTNEVDILGGYWTTQAYELEKANLDYKFISSGEISGFDQPSMVAIASEKTLKNRSEMLNKWMKATVKGAEGVIDNPELAAKEIRDKRCGGPLFDEKQELWMIKKSIPLLKQDRIGQINKKQIENFSKAYYGIDQIERAPAFNELVDMSVLNSNR